MGSPSTYLTYLTMLTMSHILYLSSKTHPRHSRYICDPQIQPTIHPYNQYFILQGRVFTNSSILLVSPCQLMEITVSYINGHPKVLWVKLTPLGDPWVCINEVDSQYIDLEYNDSPKAYRASTSQSSVKIMVYTHTKTGFLEFQTIQRKGEAKGCTRKRFEPSIPRMAIN